MTQQLITEKIVSPAVTLGMEEVAAIKVAEVERACMVQQETLRGQLKDEQAKIAPLQKKLGEQALSDAKNDHPEIEKIESALKTLFGKNAKISLGVEGANVRIHVEGHVMVPCKSKDYKAIQKEIDDTGKAVAKIEDGLCDVKKKLSQLPHLERCAKAAVARGRLEQSIEGQKILESIDKLTLPGLPAPKA